MDIESDIVTNELNNNNNSTCETMNIDQTSDVTLLLKRAIGAERRQKTCTDNFHFNENNNTNLHHMSETNTLEETEQFFHDLCAELTNTTATLVSSSTTNHQFFSSLLLYDDVCCNTSVKFSVVRMISMFSSDPVLGFPFF
jgi:hypothetical protein